ncbi:hypothetical protein ACC687_38230, partial [Rhizobium ruizarguesonis]
FSSRRTVSSRASALPISPWQVSASEICRPKLLIADEPTTALDVTIQGQILDLIKMLQEEEGMSVLFITQDMGVVAEIADRTIVMYRGEAVETGT